ncbi:hypothetical protein HNR62_002954 [Oceanisphaera litoralis]|uniref:DVU3141 family protein n=1 Tax=Oceanisphaera litoralis TaxID=225144 RepID=UPI0019583C4D|nr:DVU3141 family protein [Oceanisphaera litoralis]MBM7457052.1 hypothetical protein [Oceanisphaera litoralis]
MQLSSKKLLLPLVVLSIMTVSGCAGRQQDIAAGQHTGHKELNQYLNSSTGGATVLTNSPWGANVQIMAGQPYFAASGRSCRQLQVTPASGTSKQHIACQNKTGNWAITRPVTQLLTP